MSVLAISFRPALALADQVGCMRQTFVSLARFEVAVRHPYTYTPQ